MAIRVEFESPISVDGQPGRLFASSGHADDYLELTLPEVAGLASTLLSELCCISHEQDVQIGANVHEGPPLLLCVTALYINAQAQKTRPPAARIADILIVLSRVAPSIDFGDLLPEHLRLPQSQAQQTAAPSFVSKQQAANSTCAPSVCEAAQPVASPSWATSPLAAPAYTQPSAGSVEKARAIAARGQLHKALRAVEDVLRFAPDHFEARQLKESLKLLEQREKQRRREPRNPQVHLEAGFSYLRLQANRDAAEALQKACQLSPDLYLAQLLRGIALHRLGDVREARSAYFHAARLRPGDSVHDDLLYALESGQPPMPLAESETSTPDKLARVSRHALALAG